MATTANPVATVPKTTSIGCSVPSENLIIRGIAFWHLLSLDAPSVAVLWTWFLARINYIPLPPTAILAMGIAVWMLYAADRLLDTRSLPSNPPFEGIHAELELRHHFHRHHQKFFRWAILLSSISLAVLLPGLAPQSIRLYLALGTLLMGYFAIIHAGFGVHRAAHRLPKELAVGAFFSAATFIPTVSRNPALRAALFPGAILFAALCSLNCLFIYAWEHPSTSPQAHFATRIALRFLPTLTISVMGIGLLLSVTDHSLPRPIPLSCAIAALLLLLLHKNSHRFAPTTLRAAADICLLTPFLLLRL